MKHKAAIIKLNGVVIGEIKPLDVPEVVDKTTGKLLNRKDK